MTNPDQLAIQAGSLYRANRIEECLELLNKALSLQKSHTLSLEYKGLALQKQGKFEDALQCWDVLIANKGEIAMYFGERGVCKFNLGYKSALSDLNRAAELEPNNPFRFSARAYVKDKIGDIRGAIADYERCLELDPDDAIALNNMGIAEQKRGNKQSAEDFFAQADELMGTLNKNESESERLIVPEKSTENTTPKTFSTKERWAFIRKELKAMVSSKKGFVDFLKDLKGK